MCSLRSSYMLFTLILILFEVSEIYLISAVPALYVFGDSLLDVGNNNYIKTLSKANKKPMGIDFGKPTGRYTNGKTLVDIIGEQIGVKGFIPPYMAPTTRGKVVLKGVNYASGSSGILNQTGKIFWNNINMDAQIDNFAKTRQTILRLKGKIGGQTFLKSNSLFTVAMGSNDILNNYLIPFGTKSKQRSTPPKMFVTILITRLRRQFRRLYRLDARYFIVPELSPLGCIPYTKYINPGKGAAHQCYQLANQMAQMYNTRLEQLISELKKEFKGSVFIYVRIYDIFSDIVKNYKSYGFEKTDVACCRTFGRRGTLLGCNSFSRICPDRSKYVFWDAFHPTEATNKIIANRILDGKTDSVAPMNLRKLVNQLHA